MSALWRLDTPTAALRPPSERAWAAWLTCTRRELAAPADALLRLAAMLLEDAGQRGPEQFRADLEKIHHSSAELCQRIERLLAPDQPEPANDEWAPRVRHELRTPLAHILGYCEMWVEDAADYLLEGFVEDLRRVLDMGRQLLARLDELVAFARKARDPSPAAAPLPEVIREVVGGLSGAAAAAPAPGAPGRFLVADDNEVNRDLLCRWLRRAGHKATPAAGGREALELAACRPFDVVLLDLVMPEVNGLAVLRRLKADERLRHLPVIMISALEDVEGVGRCIELGAEDYLPKPFNPVLLQARINACLEKKRLRDREVVLQAQVECERRRADELLLTILPAEVARELKSNDAVPPRRYEGVAVLFCDLVGFTHYCDDYPPEAVVGPLQQLVERWEAIAERHQVEKIKTIGDAFLGAAGLLRRPAEHPVLHCVRCGLEMIAAARALPVGWDARVGVHLGPVVAGVIGRRQFGFDLWGDTVNTAARVESHGVPGSVVLSGTAWAAVGDRCQGEALPAVEAKGKGRLERVRFAEFREAAPATMCP